MPIFVKLTNALTNDDKPIYLNPLHIVVMFSDSANTTILTTPGVAYRVKEAPDAVLSAVRAVVEGDDARH